MLWLALAPAAHATLADLLPQNTSITPTTVTAGNNITVSYTVRNQGGTNAPSSYTKVQVKTSADVLVTEREFSTVAINANSSVNESRSITIPAGSSAGSYKTRVIVDNRSQVTQSNTSNDIGPFVSFTVQAPATLADLLPQNTSVSPTTVTAGNNITVSYTVRNQGGTNAPSSYTKVQVKTSADVLVTEREFSTVAINANSSVNESRSITIPAGSSAGSYKTRVIVDNRSQVTQSNTSNDIGPFVSFTVQAPATLADLLPQNTSVSPTTVTAGNNITVSYTVRNQGGTNAPASYTKVQVKTSADVLVTEQEFSTVAINANSSVNESRSITIPAGSSAGSYKTRVLVDNRSQVTQSNTANDIGPFVNFTVQAGATLADLVPLNTSVIPTTVTAGNNITVSYTVMNQGGTNAPTSYTKVQVKTAADVLVTEQEFSTVAINANSSVNESRSITIPAGSSAGSYKTRVLVDNRSQVTQSNTANDIGPFVNFTVQTGATLADLVPLNTSVIPTTVTAGNNITVSYTVSNQGGTNAPASYTKIQVKTSADVLVTEQEFSTVAINANSSVNESRSITIPAGSSAGSYKTRVLVDNRSQVTQSNTANDIGPFVNFTVQTGATLADLVPLNTSVSPTTVTAGNNITVSYAVNNQGGTNAPASYTKIQVKTSADVLVTEQEFSTVAINANSSVNESRSITIPAGSSAGSYKARVLVDNRSQVTQSNTANDIGPFVSFTVSASGPPPGPFTLSANAYCNADNPVGPAVLLTWTDAAGAASYQVFRNGASYANNLHETTFDNTASVSPGQTYSYFVRATNTNGSSDSNTVSVTVPTDVCSSLDPPGAFTLSGEAQCALPPSPTSPIVSLTWADAPRASWYQVFRNGYIVSEDLAATSFDDTNVSAGQTYSFEVRAVNASGISTSNPVSIPVPTGACQGPPSLKLVVLGDSYASGEGTRHYDYGSNADSPHPCHRSLEYTWGGSSPGGQTSFSVPDLPGMQVERNLFACSGAVLRHLCTPRSITDDDDEIAQLNHTSELESADMVALTLGGNDALFATLLTECVLNIDYSCRDNIPSHETQTLEALRDAAIAHLAEVLPVAYSLVRHSAPSATVFALGYPMIFPETFWPPCFVEDFISPDERDFLEETGEQLNTTIQIAAAAANIHFVPVAGAVEPSGQRLSGHEVCGLGFDWIWGLGPWPSASENFHPQLRGYQAMAAILKEYIATQGGGDSLPPNPGPYVDLGECGDIAPSQAEARASGLSLGLESGPLSVRLTGLSCAARSYLVPAAGVEIAGDAFQGLSAVTVMLEVGNYSVELATVTTNVQGDFLWTGSVPAGAPFTGDGFIKAIGMTPSGGSRTLYRTVRMAASTTSDQDADSVPDVCDNCAASSNGAQEDADGDGLGDACDLCPIDEGDDFDGDGICGELDICPFDPLNDEDHDGVCGDQDVTIFADGFESGGYLAWSQFLADEPPCSEQCPGSAALVAGLHQSFAIADSAQSGLDVTGDLTLEFWLKPASTPGNFQIVGKYDEGNNQRSYGVQYAFDDAMLLMSFSASSNCVSETVSKWPLTLPPGTWHHAAVVYAASLGQAELFIDGLSQGSRSEPPTSLCNGSATFTVGQRDNFRYYDGLIDEVRVWNVARTPAEVSSGLGVEVPCSTPGLVAYWRLNGDSADCTSNGNTLQPVNGPTFSADVPF